MTGFQLDDNNKAEATMRIANTHFKLCNTMIFIIFISPKLTITKYVHVSGKTVHIYNIYIAYSCKTSNGIKIMKLVHIEGTSTLQRHV